MLKPMASAALLDSSPASLLAAWRLDHTPATHPRSFAAHRRVAHSTAAENAASRFQGRSPPAAPPDSTASTALDSPAAAAQSSTPAPPASRSHPAPRAQKPIATRTQIPPADTAS